MKEKICAVYQIKNMVTGERYVGSSVNVYGRWRDHKKPSMRKKEPNKKLYKDFQKYGLENFMFAILAPVEPECLKQVEQEFIDTLKPAYNDRRSNGLDVERYKAYDHQLCSYNGETLTLDTLSVRFIRAGISHPYTEAKKYLLSPTD